MSETVIEHPKGKSAPRRDSPPHVFTAIANVMADLAKDGISKNRKNTQQNYAFRGVDDVYNALAPVLAEHSLIIVPRVLSREVVERQTAKGGILFYVACQVEFSLVSAEDGSEVKAVTFGEAMDSGDKATNKAMSAAYKYMAFQTFCIPTEGDNDADGTTHEIVAQSRKKTNDDGPDWLALIKNLQDEEAAGLLRDEATSARKAKQIADPLWTKILAAFAAKLEALRKEKVS